MSEKVGCLEVFSFLILNNIGMYLTRRSILTSGSIIAAGALAPKAHSVDLTTDSSFEGKAYIRELASIALNAAQGSGADYADVRLTFDDIIRKGGIGLEREGHLSVGVRSLVDGYWGFSAGPIWEKDEVARLGRTSAELAKNTVGKVRQLELGEGRVEVGHWSMPIKDDPFKMHPDEIEDFFKSLDRYINRLRNTRVSPSHAEFRRQDKAFASTDGSYLTQRLYLTSGNISFEVSSPLGNFRLSEHVDAITAAGAGFEYFRDQPLRDIIRELHESASRDVRLPLRPVEVGRHSVLLTEKMVAELAGKTLGLATELDRILGYEANGVGTSYITDPLSMINHLSIGSNSLKITANRSDSGGAASSCWDDEGERSAPFDIVSDGILRGVQANRETRGWMSLQGVDGIENKVATGNAIAFNSLHFPVVQCSNLNVNSGEGSSGNYQTLTDEIEQGFRFRDMNIHVDWQQSTGFGHGIAVEVLNGKSVALVPNAGVLFRTLELWKSIKRFSSPGTSRMFGFSSIKGQPNQSCHFSVTSPAAIADEATVIDIMRKA